MRRHSPCKEKAHMEQNQETECEVRHSGMVVQKRDDVAASPSGPLITVKVSHGPSTHRINLPSQATFGYLKTLVEKETGLDPKDQRLLFRGSEKGDNECLHTVGVKDRAKLLLLEKFSSKEKKIQEAKNREAVLKACEPVIKVRVEVDKLADKVSMVESAVRSGTKVEEKEFAVLTELLMVQLLKLDGIEADGEVKAQRKIEVRRIQSLVETLDSLKVRNSNPFSDSSNAVSVTTKWEKFDTGFGSLSAPPPLPPSEVKQDWEDFE